MTFRNISAQREGALRNAAFIYPPNLSAEDEPEPEPEPTEFGVILQLEWQVSLKATRIAGIHAASRVDPDDVSGGCIVLYGNPAALNTGAAFRVDADGALEWTWTILSSPNANDGFMSSDADASGVYAWYQGAIPSTTSVRVVHIDAATGDTVRRTADFAGAGSSNHALALSPFGIYQTIGGSGVANRRVAKFAKDFADLDPHEWITNVVQDGLTLAPGDIQQVGVDPSGEGGPFVRHDEAHDSLYAYDRDVGDGADPAYLWKYTPGVTLASGDGYTVVSPDGGRVYWYPAGTFTGAGVIYCIDMATGLELWQINLQAAGNLATAVGRVCAMRCDRFGELYVLVGRGGGAHDIVLFRIHPDGNVVWVSNGSLPMPGAIGIVENVSNRNGWNRLDIGYDGDIYLTADRLDGMFARITQHVDPPPPDLSDVPLALGQAEAWVGSGMRGATGAKVADQAQVQQWRPHGSRHSMVRTRSIGTSTTHPKYVEADNAVEFLDAQNAWLYLGDDILQNVEGHTFAWVVRNDQATTGTPTDNMFLAHTGTATSAAPNPRASVMMSSDQIRISGRRLDADVTVFATATGSPLPAGFCVLFARWDWANREASLWVDGAQVCQTLVLGSSAGATSDTRSRMIGVGGGIVSTGTDWQGAIKCMYRWNTALSDGDIAAHSAAIAAEYGL